MTDISSKLHLHEDIESYLLPGEDYQVAFDKYAAAVGNLNKWADMAQTPDVVREIKVYAEPDAFRAFSGVRRIVRTLREQGQEDIF